MKNEEKDGFLHEERIIVEEKINLNLGPKMCEKSDSITVPFTETSNMCEMDQITTKYPPILLNKYLENQRHLYHS